MKFEKLGNIVVVKKGKKPLFSEAPSPQSVRVLQIDDLRNDNNIKYTDEKTGILANEDDILLAWDGANAGTIGFGKSGYIGSTIALLRKTEPHKYSSVFIGKFLQSKFEQLRGSTTGATIPHIDGKALRNLEIPILPLNEQEHIAALLSKAESLIAARKQSLVLLDAYLKSTFLEMFGDPVRNEKGLETKKLSELGKLDRGVSKHRPRNAPELLGGTYPLIQTGDIANAGLYIYEYKNTYSELGLKQSKLWPKDTLCITIAANIGKTSILGFSACFPDSVVGFVVDKVKTTNIYVYFLFGFIQSMLEKNAPQAAQKNINLDLLRNLDVPVPNLEDQIKFTKMVEKTEALKAQYKKHLEELEGLYGSLSWRVFRGEMGYENIGDGELRMVAEGKNDYRK